jgi:hypothetical protein
MESLDSTNVVQYRNNWKDVVNTITEHLASQHTGMFLAAKANIKFTTMTAFHGARYVDSQLVS